MEFCNFIKHSPTPFHTVKNITDILEKNGFSELHENEKWDIKQNNKYYVTRNSSSVIAFSVGSNMSFNICASHSDSPCFKLKQIPTLKSNGYVRLNTEMYGGFNYSTWFDRPLSIAGRVIINENCSQIEKLINLTDLSCIIPSVAIHLDRDVNSRNSFDKQNDLLPVFSLSGNVNSFYDIVASYCNCEIEDILATELFVVSNENPVVWGNDFEFISAPRIDDLLCAYTSLSGFINSKSKSINVFCCFDNEEVGSETKQGAQSTFLSTVLERISFALGFTKEDYLIALDNSFLVSADNGHAVHPAHPEKTDAENKCVLNGGVVIKYNSNQKYMSDAVSIAKAVSICKYNIIPYQMFANNSNIPGGSTLGNLTSSNVSVKGVDIGGAQLSMHSAFETAGTKDIDWLVEFFSAFYGE